MHNSSVNIKMIVQQQWKSRDLKYAITESDKYHTALNCNFKIVLLLFSFHTKPVKISYWFSNDNALLQELQASKSVTDCKALDECQYEKITTNALIKHCMILIDRYYKDFIMP